MPSGFRYRASFKIKLLATLIVLRGVYIQCVCGRRNKKIKMLLESLSAKLDVIPTSYVSCCDERVDGNVLVVLEAESEGDAAVLGHAWSVMIANVHLG